MRRLIREIFQQHKPLGAICIAPALLALALREEQATLTIGNDPATAAALEACGARHQTCATTAVVVDRDHRIVSTPAYMLGPSIRYVACGIEQVVAEVMRMA